MRKSERILNYISAVLFGIIAVALAVAGVLLYLPYILGGTDVFQGFLAEIALIVETTAKALNIDGALFVTLFAAVPAIMFAFCSGLLFSSFKGKRGKFIAAKIIAVAITIGFCVTAGFLSHNSSYGLVMFAVLASLPVAAAVMSLISLFIPRAFAAVKETKSDEAAKKEILDAAMPESTSEKENADAKENKDESVVQPEKEIVPLYKPRETETVKEIVDRTYGKTDKEENVDDKTLAQLKRLKYLYDAGAINDYEYTQLVIKFLKK